MTQKRSFSYLFWLVPLEGILVGLFMLLDRSNSLFSDIETRPNQLVNFLGILGGFLIAFIWIGFGLWLEKRQDVKNSIYKKVSDQNNAYLLLAVAVVVLIESLQDIFIILSGSNKPDLLFIYYSSYLNILLPYLVWGVLIASGILLVLINIYYRGLLKSFKSNREFRITAIVFSILVGIWLFLGFTDFGYMTDRLRFENNHLVSGRFLPLTNPIMAHQVEFLVLILILIGLIGQWMKNKEIPGRTIFENQIVISILIWLAAFLLWSQVPIEPNYLVDFPVLPKGVIYPNSDAFHYARESQRFTAGAGFNSNSTHVMYSLFISALRMIAGENYQKIIAIQIAVISVTPVCLYHFVKKIYNEFAGLLAGGLFIIREWNALLMGQELAGANSNEFMSENLGLLGMIIFLLLLYSWVEKPKQNKSIAWVAGGVMGISLLIRVDFTAVLLAVSLGSLILLWGRKREWFGGMLRMYLIIAVIISPWVYRNWRLTGDIFLDKQNVMQNRILGYITQTLDADNQPASADNQGDQSRFEFPRKLSTIPNHFGNNLHQSFLFLPNDYQPGLDWGGLVGESILFSQKMLLSHPVKLFEESLKVHIRSTPYYFIDWDGRESVRSILPVSVSLLLIALGISSRTREKVRLNSLLITALLAHCLIWAVPSFSGNRFIKTIDWVMLVFYSIGIAKLTKFLLGKLSRGRAPNVIKNWSANILPFTNITQRNRLVILQGLIIVGLVLVGVSPAILESIIPEKYSEESLSSVLLTTKYGDIKSEEAWNSCLGEVAEDPDVDLYYGAAIYPRFYQQGEILSNDRRLIPQDPEMARIGFFLIGEKNISVILENAAEDEIFPHQASVILMGEKIWDRYIIGHCLFLINEEGENEKNLIFETNRYKK